MFSAVRVCVISLLVAPCVAIAQEDSDPSDSSPTGADRGLDALAIEMINPFGTVFSMFNRFEQTQYQGDLAGADDQSNLNWDIAASWPFLLDSGKQIVVQINFPLNFGEPTYEIPGRDYVDWRIRQDADTLPDGQPWFDGHGHLGDVSYSVGWGGTSDAGWITGIGLFGVLPTGQDGSIERDQYLLGPEFTLGKVTDWGILGSRLKHFTNVSDVSRPKDPVIWDTNETHLNIFFAYGLGNGWNIISNPTIVYDWEATSDNQWQIPLGGGVSKMMRLFGVPFKMDFELEYYVVSPDTFGAEWLARINVSPAIIQRSRN